MLLILVDDSTDILELFTGPLAVGLGYDVHPLLHEGSSAAELCQQILLMKPDIVLMDGNLANGVQGPELVPPLREGGIRVIGFSSAEWMGEEFLHAGALGFVHKDTSKLHEVVQEVRHLLQKKR